MAKTSMKVRQAREPKFSTRAYTVAAFAAARIRFFANTACAAFASASWRTRARSRREKG